MNGFKQDYLAKKHEAMKTRKESNSKFQRVLFMIAINAALGILTFLPQTASAQNTQRIAVLNIDTKQINFKPEDMGNLVRLKL